MLLYFDPPPRPADNDLGRRPAPKGETKSFEFRGGLTRQTQTRDFAYPPLGEPDPEAASWSQAPSFSFDENTLIERWEYQVNAGNLHLEVTLRAAAVRFTTGRFGIRYPTLVFARLAGTASLAWVRQT